MLWVLVRVPRLEYPQHMFLWRTDENYSSIFIEYPPYLFNCAMIEELLNVIHQEMDCNKKYCYSKGKENVNIELFI